MPETLSIPLILIPALPLSAAVITAVFGRAMGEQRAHWPVILSFAASFLLSLIVLFDVRAATATEDTTAVGYESIQTLWTWARVDPAMETLKAPYAAAESAGSQPATLPFVVDITLRADTLTAIMLAMVTFISTLVAIYSRGYMHGDRGYWRFFSYIGLFVF